MNLTFEEILHYKKKLEQFHESFPLIICPAYCYLPIMHSSYYLIGAQDISEEESGSYTGQVSASMIRSIDCNCVLLNHSEHHSPSLSVKKKLKMCLKQKLHVYLFLSETEEEHYYQYTPTKLLEQIAFYLDGLDTKEYSYISFIYEPSWLIGQDHSLSVATIQNLFYYLKKECHYLYQYDFSFLYGGGLNKKDFQKIYSLPMVDGLVLGTLSLDVDQVISLLKTLN